jgi:hypothetical protein
VKFWGWTLAVAIVMAGCGGPAGSVPSTGPGGSGPATLPASTASSPSTTQPGAGSTDDLHWVDVTLDRIVVRAPDAILWGDPKSVAEPGWVADFEQRFPGVPSYAAEGTFTDAKAIAAGFGPPLEGSKALQTWVVYEEPSLAGLDAAAAADQQANKLRPLFAGIEITTQVKETSQGAVGVVTVANKRPVVYAIHADASGAAWIVLASAVPPSWAREADVTPLIAVSIQKRVTP